MGMSVPVRVAPAERQLTRQVDWPYLALPLACSLCSAHPDNKRGKEKLPLSTPLSRLLSRGLVEKAAEGSIDNMTLPCCRQWARAGCES